MTIADAKHEGAPEQLSLPRIVVLSLLPAVLATLVRLLSVSLAASLGLPPLYSNILPWVATIAIEVGYLLYLGKKLTGRPTLRGIVLYRRPLPWWQYVVFTLLFCVWAFGAAGAMGSLSASLHETLFAWMPEASAFDAKLYTPASIIVMMVLALILNSTVGGVEELYYRGYLMPRMSRLGAWAPLISVVLWALTHFSEPWNVPLFIVMFLPVVCVAWWRKNIYVSTLVHTIGNLLNMVMMGAMIMAALA